ncbi:MAG: recombination protein RecO [Campylobacterales bacterium]
MRGFILGVRKHRDEDLILSVLTPERVMELYRFYGVRHSPLQLGHKIDFVAENDPFFLPRLRQVSHLGFSWLFDAAKVRAWQQFSQLLHAHLRGAETLDGFYYRLLDRTASLLEKQSAKRALIEASVALFEYEGRLHRDMRCLVCDRPVDSRQIALTRAFMPVHAECVYAEGFDAKKVIRLFETGESLLFEDHETEKLWRILEEGL